MMAEQEEIDKGLSLLERIEKVEIELAIVRREILYMERVKANLERIKQALKYDFEELVNEIAKRATIDLGEI